MSTHAALNLQGMSITLAQVKIFAFDSMRTHRLLANRLGGVRKYGKDTPIPMWFVAETVEPLETCWLLRDMDFPSAGAARLLAADLAAIALPVYERYQPWDGSIKQAIDAARGFAQGQTKKTLLAAAHQMAERARDRVIITDRLKPCEHYAASAAVHACAPFGLPGEMILNAYRDASRALKFYSARIEAYEFAGRIVETNRRMFEMLAPHFEDSIEYLNMYHNGVHDAAIDQVAQMEHRFPSDDSAFVDVLKKHLGGDDE